MTDTSTEAIAALMDGVTPGPWNWLVHDYSMASIEGPLGEETHVLSVGPCDGCLKNRPDDNWEWGRCSVPSKPNASFIAASRELVPALAAERDALRAERERLALAICGGEDAPGYANAQTVDALEAVAAQTRNMHAGTVNALMRAEAERDDLRAEVERLREELRFADSVSHKHLVEGVDALAENERLRAFITEFAAADFAAEPLPPKRHPEDEVEPVTDAAQVWAWQDDARGVLKGGANG